MSFEPGELIGGPLRAGAPARRGRHGPRLPGPRPAARPRGRGEGAVRALRLRPEFVERFRREASAAAGLNHPNIVAVYDRGEADGSYYIVMEYLSGPDLKQVIRAPRAAAAARGDRLRPSRSWPRSAPPTAATSSTATSSRRTCWWPRTATSRSPTSASPAPAPRADMTEAGSVIGTAQYLSPEQARGDEVTAASDCYAVGIVLYEMLTGRVPFDGGPPGGRGDEADQRRARSRRAIVEPSVPRELEAVVMRALAKRPSERYRTAEEMSRALAEARAAIDGSGGTTRVMPGRRAADRSVMGPVTGPTRVGPPPPAEPPAPAAPALAGDRRRHPGAARWPSPPARSCSSRRRRGQGRHDPAGRRPERRRRRAGPARTWGSRSTSADGHDSDVEAGTGDRHRPRRRPGGPRGRHRRPARQRGPGRRARARRDRRAEDAATAAPARAPDFTGQGPARRRATTSTRASSSARTRGRAAGAARQRGHHRRLERAREGRPCPTSARRLDRRRPSSASAAPGLEVGDVTRRPSHGARAGHGDPPGPRRRPRGSTAARAVNLVGRGRRSTTIQVPNVVGNTATDAQFKLEQRRLPVVTSDTAASDEPAGDGHRPEPRRRAPRWRRGSDGHDHRQQRPGRRTPAAATAGCRRRRRRRREAAGRAGPDAGRRMTRRRRGRPDGRPQQRARGVARLGRRR